MNHTDKTFQEIHHSFNSCRQILTAIGDEVMKNRH